MPSTPTMLPDDQIRRMAAHAVPAVLLASTTKFSAPTPQGDGKARQRIARHDFFGSLGADDGLHPFIRAGAKILLDAAEEGTHRLTDAGIDAAVGACKCAPNPDPKAIRALKGFVDCLLQGAFAGLREAGRV